MPPKTVEPKLDDENSKRPSPGTVLPSYKTPPDPAPRTRVNKTVFIGSAAGVLGIALWAILDQES
ncbi:MAG TPA: hypothetical protein VHK27_11365, partial [Gammaproteobacteria bacterium]|nr:hypothetical protein [Gammaproteobacteria bacterium]